MESYMIWQLSLCVGLLLGIMVVILIVAIYGLNWLLLREMMRDVKELLTENESGREGISDDREN